jgi:hypothetical protein
MKVAFGVRFQPGTAQSWQTLFNYYAADDAFTGIYYLDDAITEPHSVSD